MQRSRWSRKWRPLQTSHGKNGGSPLILVLDGRSEDQQAQRSFSSSASITRPAVSED